MQTPEFLKPKVLTVTQLNHYVKSLLDSDPHLVNVFVTGEISNLKKHYASGHIYFSLKDKGGVISSVMFRGNAMGLRFSPEEGMKVIVRGRVSLYEQSGNYQLYVDDMQPDGIGALTQAYEQLKKKLESQGLFDKGHKKPIPKFPKSVGVITSATGAAVQDIRNILTRRFPSIDIVLYPVQVQGDGAASQLVEAVNTFNEYDCVDVIIIGRGGGSIEDLWAFNDENLAYAIYACNIPVISAVGHETDFTICDFVSDLRAPTPSAAAELAVPDREELLSYYSSQQQYISSMLDTKISQANKILSDFNASIQRNSPEKKLLSIEQNLIYFSRIISNSANNKFTSSQEQVKKLGAKLEALSPVAVLQRGYAVCEKDDKTINSVKELKAGDIIKLTLKDGYVNTVVSEN
ncbi:MAG: exodeoxyribonuclease VII large subunit [Ruminococcus sp.]|nr:exodeoxyribonuclease VII large subunit [Ruminococcus sp.]